MSQEPGGPTVVGRLRRVPRVPSAFIPAARLAELPRQLPPLLVLRTPRGFGKTSTVAHWLRSGQLADRSVVWLPLTERVSAAALWAALLDSLALAGHVAPQAGPGLPAVRDVLERLDQRLVIVIDGLHHVAENGVDAALVELLQQHELLHLVVTTRSRREIETIGPVIVDTVLAGTRELALEPEQTRRVAADLGLELSDAEARELTAQLVGWPALIRGVLLGARRDLDGRLQIEAGAVSRFARIVLNDPENSEWNTVLTALAVPERFTAADQQALLGRGAVPTLTDDLIGTPFLDQHDDGEHAVVPAVRAALRDVLRVEDPDRFRALSEIVARRRAAEYRPGAALGHAVDAQAWPLALTLLEDNWAELLGSHRQELRGALNAMPEDIIDSSARLMVARDYILDNHTSQNAERAIRRGLLAPDSDLRVRALTTTERLGLRFEEYATSGVADILVGRLDSALRDRPAELALHVTHAIPELLTQWGLSMLYDNNGIGSAYGFALACRRAVAAGDGRAAREAATGAGLALALLGDLEYAEGWLDRALELSPETSALEAIAGPLARRAVAGLRLADLPDHDWQATSSGVGRGLTPLVELVRLTSAHRATMQGDTQRAAMELSRPATDGFGVSRPLIVATRTAVMADLAMATGDLDRAARLLADEPSDGPLIRSTKARQAYYVGAHREALRITEGALHYSGTRPRGGLELLLVRACTLLRLGRRGAAVDLLGSVVAISEDTGILLPFLSVRRSDLEDIAGTGDYVREFLDRAPLAGTDSPFPAPLRVSELSAAELRVLHELTIDQPLVRIGHRLFISESTVKTHVRRIYRKLGVSSRGAALARAEALSLLD